MIFAISGLELQKVFQFVTAILTDFPWIIIS